MSNAPLPIDEIPLSSEGVLVVFTDALGSTARDEEALVAPPAHDRPCIAGELSHSLDTMRRFRDTLFQKQLSELGSNPPTTTWHILKNVGDALVLAAYPGEQLKASHFIAECIRAVLRAWETCCASPEAAIRVAMHFCPEGHTFGGMHLAGVANAIKNMQHLDEGSRTAFLRSLRYDLFGPGMNRAARLAGAMRGPIFIISEQTYLQLKELSELSANGLRKLYSAGWQPEPGFSLRGPVPIVRAKGVDTVALPDYSNPSGSNRRPWWVWEVRGKDVETHAATFGAESKRVQTLRILHGLYVQKVPFEALTEEAGDLQAALANLLHSDQFVSFSFFCDLWLRIHEIWSFYYPQDERDFSRQKPKWSNRHATLASDFLPRYVVLTSCPDDAADAHIRDTLSFKFPAPGSINTTTLRKLKKHHAASRWMGRVELELRRPWAWTPIRFSRSSLRLPRIFTSLTAA